MAGLATTNEDLMSIPGTSTSSSSLDQLWARSVGEEIPQFELSLYFFARICIGLLLLVFLFLSLKDDPLLVSIKSAIFYTSALLFLLMALMAALLPRYGAHDWFVWSQFLFDAVFVSILLLTGDTPNNPYMVLYCVNMIAAATLIPSRSVLIVVIIDCAGYLSVQFAALQGWLPWEYSLGPIELYFKVLSEVLGLSLVGALTVFLSHQQRLTRASLKTQVQENLQIQETQQALLDELPIAIYRVAEEDIFPENAAANSFYAELSRVFSKRKNERQWIVELEDPFRVLQLKKIILKSGRELLTAEDITTIRRLEKIAATEERLASAGKLAASMAHDIRNPLAAISGAVQLLEEQQNNRLQRLIGREVTRLNELVNQFLRSASPLELQVIEHKLDPILQETIEAFRLDTRSQEIDIVLENQAPELSLLLDRGHFRQALWNLLVNAAQAISGEGTVKVKVTVSDDNESLRIAVSDTGIGMNDTIVEKIFDPFFSRRSGGTGLGLSIVKRVVQGHNGMITVLSETGQGTTFNVDLPMRKQ